jgi:hypothetical protein
MGQKETAVSGKNHIMIFGPKNDGTYVVEFRTAAGEALAISIPRTEASVVRHFQERMPYGLFVPDVPGGSLARTIIEKPRLRRTGASRRRSTSCSSKIIQSTNPHKRLSKKCRSLSKKRPVSGMSKLRRSV